MRTLVVNTGSSSLKLQVHDDAQPGDSLVGGDHIAAWDGQDVDPIAQVLARTGPVDAVGHRVVHGGPARSYPALIDPGLLDDLRSLTSLAPLHQGRAVAGIAAAREAVPGVPHVACFDTAYHAQLPDAAATYPLPARWRDRWPLKRFGFHGLSHAYAARRAAQMVPETAEAQRVVSCHLGAGASLCASRSGHSVDTTMGFTPLEGLVMATRSGSVDPGLVLWLITDAGLDPTEVREGLERSSGLAGLAGDSDMSDVLHRRQAGDSDAILGTDVYVHSLCRHIAGMTAALGGLDVLVFTAGVGEHASEIRAAVGERLAYLGVRIDPAANEASRVEDLRISPPDAQVATLVVEAREDLEIIRQVRVALSSG